MNNEKLRADIKRELNRPTSMKKLAELLNRCYVALGEQQDAEPIGKIYDIDGVHMAIWVNGTPEVGTELYAAPSPGNTHKETCKESTLWERYCSDKKQQERNQ